MSAPLAKFDTLNAGDQYVFTYSISGLLGFEPFTSTVQEKLGNFLQAFGDVNSVDRGFLSGYFTIVVTTSTSTTLETWQDFFASAFQQIGWTFTFIECDAGTVSAQTGGIKQAVVQDVSSIADMVGNSAAGVLGGVIKPLAPYIILFAAGFLIYEYSKSTEKKA